MNHDHKCDKCGKPATINIQDVWHKYAIDKTGKCTKEQEWQGNNNYFYCDECYILVPF